MLGSFRRRLGALIGGFEAAQGSRRLKGFQPSRAHVNTLVAASGLEIIARARYLVRNNGFTPAVIISIPKKISPKPIPIRKAFRYLSLFEK